MEQRVYQFFYIEPNVGCWIVANVDSLTVIVLQNTTGNTIDIPGSGQSSTFFADKKIIIAIFSNWVFLILIHILVMIDNA